MAITYSTSPYCIILYCLEKSLIVSLLLRLTHTDIQLKKTYSAFESDLLSCCMHRSQKVQNYIN